MQLAKQSHYTKCTFEFEACCETQVTLIKQSADEHNMAIPCSLSIREWIKLTLYVPWKCLISSGFTYEGVMSLPPPNHHWPGTPPYWSVSKYLATKQDSVFLYGK